MGQRTLGASAKEGGQYPEKHGKLPRPTRKELHLHFQVTEARYIKSVPQVMKQEKHVTERCHQLRRCIRVLQTAPQTPRLGAPQIQLELRREGVWSETKSEQNFRSLDIFPQFLATTPTA